MDKKFNTYVWVMWLATAVICSVLTYNPAYLGVICLSAVLILKRNKVGVAHPILMGALFSIPVMLINILLVHHGETVLYRIPASLIVLGVKVPIVGISGPITLESLAAAFIFALLLITLFLVFSVFNRIVTSDALIRVFPKSLVHSSLVASIAVRFAPMIAEDFKSITDVQKSRGLMLNKAGKLQNLKKRVSIIIPTVVNSLEKSYNLAEAMEARCYTGDRTKYVHENWSRRDVLYTLLFAVPLLYLLALKLTGSLEYWNAMSAVTIMPEIKKSVVISLLLLAVPSLEDGKDNKL
ncbi:MAG: energy-coupling factor transporter transmembrane component T [Candidatus Altiarchaeota archaeon]